MSMYMQATKQRLSPSSVFNPNSLKIYLQAPLATQCQQLLQVLSDTQDCMESTSNRLTAKQNEVRKIYNKSITVLYIAYYAH